MDVIAFPQRVAVPASERARMARAIVHRGPRPKLAAPRMATESLEALAAVTYAAIAEYAHRCLGETPWPEWGRIEDRARELWMRRVEREVAGRFDPQGLIQGQELSEVRRYLLVRGIVTALTAVAA